MKDLVVKVNKYYIGSFKKSLEKIEYLHEPLAKPIALSGYEEFDLFILKEETKQGIYWRISESYTGFRLYYSSQSEIKGSAIKNLLTDMLAKKITKKKLKDLINESIDKWGLSPRFK